MLVSSPCKYCVRIVASLHVNTLLFFSAVLCAKNLAKKDFFRKYLLATSCKIACPPLLTQLLTI